MKTIKSMFLTSLALIGVAAAGGQDFRTDINPALRYYQALILGSELSPADSRYFFDNEWRGQKLPERFGQLVSNFNTEFRVVREAGQATVPCDWGIDLSAGPETMLPHLGRLKSLAVTAKLRVLWELQSGKETEARDDLLATFALGRNASKDGTLIAALVQFAIENIALNTVAENFHSFSAETLRQLAEGFDAAPAGNTVADTIISGEKACFHDWLERKVLQWQKENPGDDAKVMAELRQLFARMGDDSGKTNQLEEVIGAAGTSEGVLKLLRQEDAIFQRAADLMALPHPAFEEQAKQFQAEIEKANPLAALTFPAILKARPKEFRMQAKLAMFHAAVAYKLHGEEGLRSVNDPFGQGPFQFERFVFEGLDRGFKLTSAYAGNGYPETLIFVETEGTPFLCDGPKAGQPLDKIVR
jgi:hypothetical protein